MLVGQQSLMCCFMLDNTLLAEAFKLVCVFFFAQARGPAYVNCHAGIYIRVMQYGK